MKSRRVYLFVLLMGLSIPFVSTGCARKSGCPATEAAAAPAVKKNGKARRKGQTELFSKKMRRKIN